MCLLTCLSICEYASVVPLEGIVENVPAEAFEDRLLRGKLRQLWAERVETVIERERLWLFPGNKSTHEQICVITMQPLIDKLRKTINR